MKTLSMLVATAVALAACTPMEVTTPPIMVTPTVASKAVGIDVYAVDRARGNPVPSFRGQKTVPVRANGKLTGGGFGELSGVPCTADAGVYSASFLTPANLNVPDYGPSSPSIFVRCVLDDRSGSVTVDAVNFTAQQRQSSAIGTGILGAIIIGAVAASKRDDQNDDFKYPPIAVSIK
ncbi:hypothetical protein A9Q96_14135 [Rhodobacterales bacterium 52_120_T64]|nr:hypothetical protein A9Q96_14135 [Rhodobacterales bacterium 52_120_T64]